MSRRSNAPYDDALNDDESELIYEGHDTYKQSGIDPKAIDQPRYNEGGQLTQNGQFADWVDKMKSEAVGPAVFRVYEKLRSGIWSDRGLYKLLDYWLHDTGIRKVFKFALRATPLDSDQRHEVYQYEPKTSRQIPSWVKQQFFKRDRSKCVICGANDQLHFDHELPFSKGGASVTPTNVRILCARHNLQKSARIE